MTLEALITFIMRTRLINAINNPEVSNFINDTFCFPWFLKGGFEDMFSMILLLKGFHNNNDLIAQYSINQHARPDIASRMNNTLPDIIEFGHQFSLQFPRTSGLAKLQADARNRLQPETGLSNLYTVQIISDVIYIDEAIRNSEWCQYYSNRYMINESMANRTNAIQRINDIKETIDQFNVNHNFGTPLLNLFGDHIVLNIDNLLGTINLNFIINGPYTYQQRITI